MKAVAFIEITLIRLKARKQAISHLDSKRRFMTARVRWRAVAFIEITLIRLKARKQAISHQSSKRRFATARVRGMAVDFSEATFYPLLVKTSYKNILPSSILKISMRDCLYVRVQSSADSIFS